MKKREYTLGFSLIEISIALFLLSSIFLIVFYRVNINNERIELELTTKKIDSFVNKYTTTAHYQKKNFNLEIDLKEKSFLLKDNNRVIDKLNLSPKLSYEIVFDKKRNPLFNIEITKNGNMSRAFTLYIFGYRKQLENKLTFFTFQKERILKINIYKVNNLEGVNYTNILEYHYLLSKNSDWLEVG